jgi:hypothetical protein
MCFRTGLGENLTSSGIRSLEHHTCTLSLYRLTYRGSTLRSISRLFIYKLSCVLAPAISAPGADLLKLGVGGPTIVLEFHKTLETYPRT